MNALVWECFEYKVAGVYLPALINGDHTGLENGETRDLNQWERDAMQAARAAGFTVGHWDCDADESDDWGPCAISGLFAMRQPVRLLVWKDSTK